MQSFGLIALLILLFFLNKESTLIKRDDQKVSLAALRIDSPEFTTQDFTDIALLSRNLNKDSSSSFDPTASSYIFNLLKLETQEQIKNYKPSGEIELKKNLVSDFNELLISPSLYNSEKFKNVPLRTETRQMIKQNTSQDESHLTQLNRLLIEDVFPVVIVKLNQFVGTNIIPTENTPVIISPNKTLAAFSDPYGYLLKIYDLKADPTPKKFNRQKKTIYCENCKIDNLVSFSKDDKYILATGHTTSPKSDNLLLVWEVNTDNNSNDIPFAKQIIKMPIEQGIFNPDNSGDIAITTPNSTEIQIWNININKQEKLFSLEKDKELSDLDNSGGNKQQKLVSNISYSKDGKYIVATVKGDDDVRVWKAKKATDIKEGISGKLFRTFRGHKCQVNNAEFDDKGEWITTAGDDGTAFVWDFKNNSVKYELRGYRGLFIYANKGGIHQVFPVPQLFQFNLSHKEGEYVPVNTARLSPDRKLVVTASIDGKVRVWTLKNSRIAANKFLLLQGYTGNVRSAEFSPDGKFVIAAGEDGTARIWNIESLDSSLFTEKDDFIDIVDLIKKLKTPKDSLSEFLSKEISSATHDLLNQFTTSSLPSSELIKGLVNDFNKLISNKDFRNEKGFTNVKLKFETKSMKAKTGLNKNELIRLNWMYLEDAKIAKPKDSPPDNCVGLTGGNVR